MVRRNFALADKLDYVGRHAITFTMRPRVAVCSTHPIQYQVPWLQGLVRSGSVDLKAFYSLIPDARQQASGFGIPFTWDIPLLEGYQWEQLPSARSRPSLESFFGNSTPGVYARLAATKPNVLILTGWNTYSQIQAWRAGRRLGVPMLLRCEANAMCERPWWVRAVHRQYLGTIRGFLAIGASNRRFYGQYGITADRIWDAPYFVDNVRIRESYERDRPGRADLRTRWGIPQDAFCFLYVGKLEPKKRLPDLLEALSIMDGVGSSRVHLLVVGAGELMNSARALVEQKSLPVTFAGFLNQTQLTQAYAAGDCLVLPSDYGETWGLVVNEAMVCGLPVIVSDRVGCGPDLARPGETGLVFPFGEVAALTQAMESMRATPARAAEMGRQARERISSYSSEAAVAGTLEAIRAVTVPRAA